MSILYIRDKNGNFVQMPSVPGKSAYEIAVAKGTFSGTEQEFAEMQVINNKEIIDQITQENIDNWNSAKGMTDEEKEQLANKIDKVELTDDNYLIFYSNDIEKSRIEYVQKESHNHTNKSVLDGITASKVISWDEMTTQLNIAINKIDLLEVRIQELELEISKLVPIVGTVNEDNTITMYGYDTLNSGIYTLEYDFEGGTQEELEVFTVNENQINLMEDAEIRINSRYSKSGGGYIDVDGVICFTIPFINDNGNAMRLEFDNLTYTMLTSDCILYILDNDKSNPSEVNGNTVISEMTSGVEVADDGLSGTITFTPSINEGYITISIRTKDDDTATTADEFKDYIAILTMEVTE